MSETETRLPGEALLQAAEQEIGKGNLHKGAGLVWEATMEALAAAAARHGMPCGDREEAVKFVNHLDDLAEPPSEKLLRFANLAAFSVAETYRDHHEELEEFKGTEFEWEPAEYALYLDSVRHFVNSLNSRQIADSPR